MVMKVMARLCFLAVMILGLPAIAMSEDDVSGKLTIYVVNYPLQYFAQRIAEAHATVAFPVPPDVDPAFWNPGVEVIAEYQRADLIILNGANYAKWIDKVTLPRSKLVDTSASFKDQYIPLANLVMHTHGPGGEHADTGVAPTTWLDFHLAADQARAIADAMSRKRPALRDIFESNYKALEDDLLRLDRDLKGIVVSNMHEPLVASHPVYQYFARRYGLDIKSVHWEPHEVPSDEQWLELQAILREHPARWMIWEGAPEPESAATLKSLGINSVVFIPQGNTPADGNFLTVMLQNADRLRLVFSK